MADQSERNSSPDPLALSIDSTESTPGLHGRDSSAGKRRGFTPLLQMSPRRKSHGTPQKQSGEMVLRSPDKGDGSPWRIRVTVEAEENDEADATPRVQGFGRTVKVPVKTGDGGTTPRRRNKRANDASDGGAEGEGPKRRKRNGTPMKRVAKRRESGLVEDFVDADDAQEVIPRQSADARQSSLQMLSPLGAAGSNARSRVSPLRKAPGQTPRETEARVLRNPHTQEDMQRPSHDVAPSETDDGISYDSGSVIDAAEDFNLENDTQALDQSAMESENFSMVSIDSLRAQKEIAQREANEAYEEALRTQKTLDQRQTAAANRSVQNTELSAKQGSSARSSDPSRAAFSAFGDKTRRGLHNGLKVGEMLARSNDDRSRPSVSNSPGIEQLGGVKARNAVSRRASAKDPSRLPTPSDSVVSDREKVDERERPPSRLSKYDEMSWKHTTLPRQSLSSDQRNIDEMSWKPTKAVQTQKTSGDDIWLQEQSQSARSSNVPRNQTTSTENHDAASTTYLSIDRSRGAANQIAANGRPEADDVEMIDVEVEGDATDIWQDEADRSLEDSIPENRRQVSKEHVREDQRRQIKESVTAALKRQSSAHLSDVESPSLHYGSSELAPFKDVETGSPVPSLSEFVPADTAPARGKLPRSWRRVSAEDFLYSDETEEAQETPRISLVERLESSRTSVHGRPPPPPSVFARWSAKSSDPSDKVGPLEEQEEAEEEEDQASEDETGHDEPVDSSPLERRRLRRDGSLRSILSTPERRASSPSKEVKWSGRDMVRSLDSPEDSSQVLSSPLETRESGLNARGKTYPRLFDDNAANNVNSKQEQSLSDSAEKSVKTSSEPRCVSILARLASWFFTPSITTPILPSSAKEGRAPQASPLDWTNNHYALLSHYYHHSLALRPEKPFIRTEASTRGNFVRKPPPGPRLPQAFFDALEDMPQRFTMHIGQNMWTRPRCTRDHSFLAEQDAKRGADEDESHAIGVGQECPPDCAGIPVILQGKEYSTHLTELDIRVAWAFAVEVRERGLPMVRSTSERQGPERDSEGRVRRVRADWIAEDECANEVVRRVFSLWVGQRSREDEIAIGEVDLD